MNVRRELDSLLESVPAAEMSDLIGELERVKSAAYCRMLARETQRAANGRDPKPADLSTADIATMYDKSRQTVRGWIGKGLLDAYKFPGREWRVTPESFEKFRREQREPLKLEVVKPPPDLRGWRKAAVG